MRINTQLPMAVHILAVLAFFETEPPTSEIIAKSVGTNPVVVRRLIAQLKRAGLVDAQAGVRGASLRKKPGEITLLEVYNAVRAPGEAIFDMHPHPSPVCKIGAYIPDAVGGPLMSAQRAMEEKLASFTLMDVVAPISEKNGLQVR